MNTAVCKLLLFDRVLDMLMCFWLLRFSQLRKKGNCCRQQRPDRWRWCWSLLHSWWSTCQEQCKLMREAEAKRSGELREGRVGKESYGSEPLPWIFVRAAGSSAVIMMGFWGCNKVGNNNQQYAYIKLKNVKQRLWLKSIYFLPNWNSDFNHAIMKRIHQKCKSPIKEIYSQCKVLGSGNGML